MNARLSVAISINEVRDTNPNTTIFDIGDGDEALERHIDLLLNKKFDFFDAEGKNKGMPLLHFCGFAQVGLYFGTTKHADYAEREGYRWLTARGANGGEGSGSSTRCNRPTLQYVVPKRNRSTAITQSEARGCQDGLRLRASGHVQGPLCGMPGGGCLASNVPALSAWASALAVCTCREGPKDAGGEHACASVPDLSHGFAGDVGRRADPRCPLSVVCRSPVSHPEEKKA